MDFGAIDDDVGRSRDTDSDLGTVDADDGDSDVPCDDERFVGAAGKRVQ
jgi:hypothetical protein